jgi:hypothetical protein
VLAVLASCALDARLITGSRGVGLATASASGGSGGGGAGGGGGGGGPGTGAAPWCAGVAPESGASRVELAVGADQPAGLAVPAIIQGLCHPDDEAREARGALEAARRRWMARLLMRDADWTDAVAFAQLPHDRRMAPRELEPTPGLRWSTLPPIEQWALLRMQIGPSDSFALQPGAHLYIADALPLAEAGRLAVIERCLFVRGVSDDPYPAEWATCQPDIEALDAGKLAAELRAATDRAAEDRMRVRLAYDTVQRALPGHAARVARLTARDPAYAEAFAVARAARADWARGAPARAELLAAALELDDARATRSQRALAGCAARAWPRFTATVSALPAARFDGLRGDPERAVTFTDAAAGAVLQDPAAYLAALALVACEGPADPLLAKLGAALSTWPGLRGPRTAALTQLQLAGLEPDTRGERIEVPRVSLPLAAPRREGSAAPQTGASAEGIIAAVAPVGEGVRVSFRATAEAQEQCAARRTTRRISRIDSSGNVIYESVCTTWRRVRVDTTPRPIVVRQRYSAGLAPGRYVAIVGGVPEAVWPSPNARRPLAALGALVK